MQKVYGRPVGKWPFIYLCVGCGAFVGVHNRTDIPLGTLADRPLRELRQKAKSSFLAVVELQKMRRSDAYVWLAKQLCKPVCETHYGWMDATDLQKALTITEAVHIQHTETFNV